MNAKLTTVTLVGLTAMIALLAGCTSNQQGENQEKSAYPAGCASSAGYSNQTGQACSEMQELKTEINNLQQQINELRGQMDVVQREVCTESDIGLIALNSNMPCTGIVTTTTTTTTVTSAFSPAPDHVAYFTQEITWQGCTDSSTGRFYSPPNGVGTYGMEWWVNTGSERVTLNYGGRALSGEKEIATNGEWQPLAVSSDAFYFCFYPLTDEAVTIALALPPPQKG